jgi:hypothetical protein
MDFFNFFCEEYNWAYSRNTEIVGVWKFRELVVELELIMVVIGNLGNVSVILFMILIIVCLYAIQEILHLFGIDGIVFDSCWMLVY